MLFSTVGQMDVFLWMVVCGGLIGGWYGLIWGLRRLFQAGFWLNLGMDLAFGLGAAGLFLSFSMMANYGRVRLYAIGGVVLGGALFALILWPPIHAVGRGLFRGMCRLCFKIKQNRLIKVIFR